MELIQVDDTNQEFLAQVKTLYFEAFPKEERKPYKIIEQKQREGKMQIWAIVQEANNDTEGVETEIAKSFSDKKLKQADLSEPLKKPDLTETKSKENDKNTGEFCGLAITILAEEMVLLDYFAIDPKKRGNGIGSRVLELLKKKYADSCLFLEIESTDEKEKLSKEEQQIREKRKRFYYQNGMKDAGLFVVLFGVPMEVLSDGRKIRFEEYLKVYTDTFGEKVAEKIECVGR